ncbi:MAG TPA: isoamylase early set domain-containing protein [Candidatus Bathyarchaeia archaeon]|nr:isoamylase early set domain-containing protein [Candidatus Bathyarchaeia archaeon]
MKHRIISFVIPFVALVSVLVASCGTQMPQPGIDGSARVMGPQSAQGGIMFVLYAPKAHKVAIVGDFNNWSTNADQMYDREGKGMWSITLPLKPGHYEYKFLVDGEKWTSDLGNPKRVKDGFGAFNSVVEVKP